jgi:hypothetical protein
MSSVLHPRRSTTRFTKRGASPKFWPSIIEIAYRSTAMRLAETPPLMIHERMKMNLPREIVFLAVLIVGCQTTTQTTNRVSVGMTQPEVLRSVGKPFSKSAEQNDGVLVETWIYKETTWDQGGWSWNRTVSDSAVVFRNGRVVSYGVAKEHRLHQNPMNPGVNVNVHRDE